MARSLVATIFSDPRVIDDDDQNNHDTASKQMKREKMTRSHRESFDDDKSDVGRASLWRLLAICLSPLLINKKT